MATLFTVEPPLHAGFTDQLTTLALAYDVGVRCGYEFRLTPFDAVRSGTGFWADRDLAAAFRPLGPEEEALPATRVELSAARARERGARTPHDLAAIVREQVPEGVGRVVLGIVEREFFLREIRWDESPALATFHAGLQRVFAPRQRWSDGRGLRVCVHLRCGDTADIPLIGPVNYRLWGRRVRPARPAFPAPFLGARLVIDVVRDLRGAAGADFRVFSDGYERTARGVGEAAGPGGTITDGLGRLLDGAIALHAEAARGVMTGDNVALSMGESPESLDHLIDSVQEADLVVVTGAQRMIPKLLAALGPRPLRPGLLLLDAERHRGVRRVRLDERHARLITLSPHGDPLAPLRAFLGAAAKPAAGAEVARLAALTGAGVFCVPEVEALAAELEARDRAADARTVYEWLAVLTDGGPGSLAGAARCAERLGDGAAAEELRARAAVARARCLAGYRAAIQWATVRGYPHEARALRDEAVRLLGTDVELGSPPPRA